MKTSLSMRMIALIALCVAALTACASGDVTDVASSPADQPATGSVVGTLAFNGFEMGFKPATVEVDQPGRYAVTLTNTGHIDHDWSAGDTKLVAKPGETVSGEIMVPAEGLEFVCSVPGHAAAGMRGTITVKSGAGAQNR